MNKEEVNYVFRICFGKEVGDKVDVQVVAPTGSANEFITLPFTRGEIETLLEAYNVPINFNESISNKPIGHCDLRQIGVKMYEHLFVGGIKDQYQRSLGKCPRNMIVEIQFDLRNGGIAPRLPWEALRCPDDPSPFALQRELSIVRTIAGHKIDLQPEVQEPLRILAIVANPKADGLRQFDAGLIKSDLRNAWEGEKDNLIILEPPTQDAFYTSMKNHRPHIIHFTGHGGWPKDQNAWSIGFEDNNGGLNKITGEYLAQLIEGLDERPRLAIFTSCDTARLSLDKTFSPFHGVAVPILRAGVSAVVAMQFPIFPDSALYFNRAILNSIMAGDNIHEAVIEGRRAIHKAKSSSAEFITPVLFTHPDTDRLFAPEYISRPQPQEPKNFTQPAQRPVRYTFLSYCRQNNREVEMLEMDLKKLGVHVWRDRSKMKYGEIVGRVIEEAINGADNILFYFSKEAMGSEWMLEKELEWTLNRYAKNRSLSITPIFQTSKMEILDILKEKNINGFNLIKNRGDHVVESLIEQGRYHEACREVATGILATHLNDPRIDSEIPLTIGIATRQAPSLRRINCDLLLDWSEVFDSNANLLPDEVRIGQDYKPLLETFRETVVKSAPHHKLRIYPQCHLSLAMAVGNQFNINNRIDLEIIDPTSFEPWDCKFQLPEPDKTFWSEPVLHQEDKKGDSVMVLSITIPHTRAKASIEKWVIQNKNIGPICYLEPKKGPGRNSMCGLGRAGLQKAAAAVSEEIERLQEKTQQTTTKQHTTHLFLIGPAVFAVALGHMLVNRGVIQTYEHIRENDTYQPSFKLI